MNEKREQLIAPCGMNCGLCMAYQREKTHCKGCRIIDDSTSKSCRNCIIRNCPTIQSNKSGFCYECDEYPCHRLKNLDKRYRTKYHMSMIENLETIKQNGIAYFLQLEEKRWACPKCGSILCVHRSVCPNCHSEVFIDK